MAIPGEFKRTKVSPSYRNVGVYLCVFNLMWMLIYCSASVLLMYNGLHVGMLVDCCVSVLEDLVVLMRYY